jgi:hypothetical protein
MATPIGDSFHSDAEYLRVQAIGYYAFQAEDFRIGIECQRDYPAGGADAVFLHTENQVAALGVCECADVGQELLFVVIGSADERAFEIKLDSFFHSIRHQ